MKSIIIFLLISSLLISCATYKSIVIDYNSEKLCNGIENLTNFIENSNDVKSYFLDKNSNSTDLKYEIDTLITEGISFMFLQYEVANYVMNEEKISFEEVNKRLEMKFLVKPNLELNSRCLKRQYINHPTVNIKYYYYPEYGLLTAEISKIKYIPEYGKGYLILAKIELNGDLKIIKTSFWEE